MIKMVLRYQNMGKRPQENSVIDWCQIYYLKVALNEGNGDTDFSFIPMFNL